MARRPKSLRKNAKVTIAGRWQDRDSSREGLAFADETSQTEYLEQRERYLNELEDRLPRRGRVPEWSTNPLSTEGTPPRPVHQRLVPDDAPLDLGQLLEAYLRVTDLLHEATVGLGQGGLFNYERDVLSRLVTLGTDLAAWQGRANAEARAHAMHEELRAIYQLTLDDWPTGGTATAKPKEPRLPPGGAAVVERQSEAIALFLRKYELPDTHLGKLVIHAPFIRKNDGALKVAARKLKELSVVEGSLLAQGRRAASRLAGWRVQQQRALTEPTTNHAVDEVAALSLIHI